MHNMTACVIIEIAVYQPIHFSSSREVYRIITWICVRYRKHNYYVLHFHLVWEISRYNLKWYSIHLSKSFSARSRKSTRWLRYGLYVDTYSGTWIVYRQNFWNCFEPKLLCYNISSPSNNTNKMIKNIRQLPKKWKLLKVHTAPHVWFYWNKCLFLQQI